MVGTDEGVVVRMMVGVTGVGDISFDFDTRAVLVEVVAVAVAVVVVRIGTTLRLSGVHGVDVWTFAFVLPPPPPPPTLTFTVLSEDVGGTVPRDDNESGCGGGGGCGVERSDARGCTKEDDDAGRDDKGGNVRTANGTSLVPLDEGCLLGFATPEDCCGDCKGTGNRGGGDGGCGGGVNGGCGVHLVGAADVP